MSAALLLQQRLNVVRRHRSPSPLALLEETGRPNEDTRNALRAFQHEYNIFAGEKVLMEKGQLDPKTEEALAWFNEVLRDGEEAA